MEEIDSLIIGNPDARLRTDFKPLHPYIVSYRNQEAADAGGVSRQFFTNLFGKFKVEDRYFEGPGKH